MSTLEAAILSSVSAKAPITTKKQETDKDADGPGDADGDGKK